MLAATNAKQTSWNESERKAREEHRSQMKASEERHVLQLQERDAHINKEWLSRMEKMELYNKVSFLEAENKRQATQSERDAVSRKETKENLELFQKRETQEGVQNAMQKVVAEFNDKLVEKDRVSQQHMKNKKKKQEEKQAAAALIAKAEETARKASETEQRKKSKRRRERSNSRSSDSSDSGGGRRKRSSPRNRRRTHSPDRRRDRSSMGKKQRRRSRSRSRSRANTENIDKAPPPPKSNNPPTPLKVPVPAKVTLADIQNWTGLEVNNWLIKKGLIELGQLCSNSGLLRNGLFLVQSAKALSGIRQKIIVAGGIEDEEADMIVHVFETALTDLISQK
jgi:hypothetical protein